MQYEKDLLALPCNLPTLSSIDMARQNQEEELRLHSAHPPLYYWLTSLFVKTQCTCHISVDHLDVNSIRSMLIFVVWEFPFDTEIKRFFFFVSACRSAWIRFVEPLSSVVRSCALVAIETVTLVTSHCFLFKTLKSWNWRNLSKISCRPKAFSSTMFTVCEFWSRPVQIKRTNSKRNAIVLSKVKVLPAFRVTFVLMLTFDCR